jgi:hypothetical protein
VGEGEGEQHFAPANDSKVEKKKKKEHGQPLAGK